MSNPISKLFASLKQSRFVRATFAVVAGFVLLLNAACSPKAPEVSGTGSYEKPRTQPTELYDTVQKKQDGMNVYSDTDPRRETNRLSSDVKARVQQAERNLDKVQSPDELGSEVKNAAPFRRGSEDVSNRVGDTVEDFKQDFSEGTKQGIKNIQRNVEQAKQGIQGTFDDARQNASEVGKDAVRNAQQTTDELKGNAQRAASQVKGNAMNAGDDIQDTAKDVQRSAKAYSSDLKNNLGERS